MFFSTVAVFAATAGIVATMPAVNNNGPRVLGKAPGIGIARSRFNAAMPDDTGD